MGWKIGGTCWQTRRMREKEMDHKDNTGAGSERITDQGYILLYVGTVGKIGENGVHVLNISDGNG